MTETICIAIYDRIAFMCSDEQYGEIQARLRDKPRQLEVLMTGGAKFAVTTIPASTRNDAARIMIDIEAPEELVRLLDAGNKPLDLQFIGGPL